MCLSYSVYSGACISISYQIKLVVCGCNRAETIWNLSHTVFVHLSMIKIDPICRCSGIERSSWQKVLLVEVCRLMACGQTTFASAAFERCCWSASHPESLLCRAPRGPLCSQSCIHEYKCALAITTPKHLKSWAEANAECWLIATGSLLSMAESYSRYISKISCFFILFYFAVVKLKFILK